MNLIDNYQMKYEVRGLTGYKLQSLEDIKAIYGQDIRLLKGFSDLSKDNQDLFKKFIVNFFNAWGLDTRPQFTLQQVNYVQETVYMKPSEDLEVLEGSVYEDVATVIKRLNSKGMYVKFLVYNHQKENLVDCKIATLHYLRIDYKRGTQKNWLHIFSPEEWG